MIVICHRFITDQYQYHPGGIDKYELTKGCVRMFVCLKLCLVLYGKLGGKSRIPRFQIPPGFLKLSRQQTEQGVELPQNARVVDASNTRRITCLRQTSTFEFRSHVICDQ